jgi:transcriptional regulator with XRE-family HTH domain
MSTLFCNFLNFFFHFGVNSDIILMGGIILDINKYAAEKLKQLRVKNNMTQEQLAKNLNVTQQQIARYENNKRLFKQDFLFKLADFFNVSINVFFPDNDEAISSQMKNCEVLYSKLKDLSDEDKKFVINYINEKKRQIDEQMNNKGE